MRSTVIPAQITTVEDKIMGNLNLTQIVLLMAPVFWATIVYTFLLPQMKFVWYKLPLTLIVLLACVILALKIKSKLVLQWLEILLRYNLRPKYFVFNKNDAYLRKIEHPKRETKQTKSTVKASAKRESAAFIMKDLVNFEGLLSDPSYSFSIKSGKKGGLHVALEQVK